MSLKLIKALLNKEFHDKYKHKLSKDYFIHDNNVKGLFLSLEKAYETIEADLTVDSLKELHYSYNPTISLANKKVLEGVFTELSGLDLTKETSEIVLKQAIEQHLWTELANIGIQGGDGLKTDFLRAQDILDNIRSGITLHRDVNIVTGTIEEMLEATSQQMKWKFNISTLLRRIDGIGPSTFTLIAARPNVGKTGLCTNFVAGPGGFLEQGAKVAYVSTEEAGVRTRLRMASCYSGLDRSELYDSVKRAYAQTQFDTISGNLTFLDLAGYSIEELDKYLKDNREPIDILVVDVLDKLQVDGVIPTAPEELYKLYVWYRELLKKHNIAGIGTSQASADAENRAVFGMDCLTNSKTGKGGELDVCLCLGRHLDGDNPDQGFRTLNIAKNKLTGIEDYVTFNMDFSRSRAIA